jgi:hypothetical protein
MYVFKKNAYIKAEIQFTQPLVCIDLLEDMEREI